MKLILLSGGSGKRLWPISNDARSKQFLKVLWNDCDQVYESMVQRVWRQLEHVGLEQNTVVTTSKSQAEMIEIQLNNVIKIIEPSRRDTFPAIALSVAYLKDHMNISDEETIVVSPVDPYVESSYFENIKKLSEVLTESNTDLALMGVVPTEPSEKFGYIVPEKKSFGKNEIKKVEKFKEKPDKKEAQELIESGALWNCGVFAFKYKTLKKFLDSKGYNYRYDDILNSYEEFPKISFDYEFVEYIESIAVLPFKGAWEDLGTWGSLTQKLHSNRIGNVISNNNCNNTHIINELDIPIVCLGIDNAIIAASPDGILISNKLESEKIKDVISSLDDTPMFEERIWGSFKTLDYVNHGHIEVVTKRVRIDKGKKISYQYHEKRKEIWTILSGEAEVNLDGIVSIVGSGKVIEIDAGVKHSIHAINNIELIEVQQGLLEKEDVIRINYQTL